MINAIGLLLSIYANDGEFVNVNGMNCFSRKSSKSGAFPFDAGFPALFVLVLGDPHLLEGAQRGENRAADPGRKAPLRRLVREQQLQPHAGGKLLTQVVVQTVREAWMRRIGIDL